MIHRTDEVVNRIVTRDVPDSERGTIATLNDLPDWMVAEARLIARESRLAALRYLKFYVAEEYATDAPDFVEDVLRKGQDARTWNIRDCICIPYEPTRLTALEINYLDVLAQVRGERWFRVRPKPTDHPSSHIPGAVGVVLRNTRYWEKCERDVTRYMFSPADALEAVPVDRVKSTIRRWIAHRLAWWTTDFIRQAALDVTGDDIIAAVPGVNMQRVTADARIAAAALAREAIIHRGSPHFPQQAGFLGPEKWYQSYQSPSQDVASTAGLTSPDKESHD